jgi:hypothetical protein
MARSAFHAPIPRTNLGLIRRGGRAIATDARVSARTPSGQGAHCCFGLAASGAVRRREMSWPALSSSADVRADGLAVTQAWAPVVRVVLRGPGVDTDVARAQAVHA